MSEQTPILILLIFILALLIMSVMFFCNIRRGHKIIQAMEKKYLEHEISILKNQMSPHFILNTINNISVLMDSDKERSKDLLIKFGDLLRYSTYEVGNHKVELSKTLDYLDKYIELQRLRFKEKDSIHFSVHGDPENKFIAPMLLLPFVENAFKYGQRDGGKNPSIKIEIRISENNLSLFVRNYIKKRQKYTEKGIGINNTTKRLELIYPNQHNLNIYNDGDQFFVKLDINDLKWQRK